MGDSVGVANYSQMYQRSRLPREPEQEGWVGKQTLNYPHHSRHGKLIAAYESAQQTHKEALKTLEFAIRNALESGQSPEQVDANENLNGCRQAVSRAASALDVAEQNLKEYNSHTPSERIALYQNEVAALEAQLVTALAEENSYTEELLSNPHANRLKLERLVHGYKGIEAEYSAEELSKLRTLRNKVESLKSQIQRHIWDIQKIEELAAEAEKREQIQSEMNVLLPKFGKAAAKFVEALNELQSAAREHEILCDVSRVKIPVGAKLKLSTNPYDGASCVILQWE